MLELRSCSHDPWTTHYPVATHFASVHGVMPVTVHTSFRCPGATLRGGLPVVQLQITHLAKVSFLHVNGTQKLPQGKSSLVHAYY